jgi:hypothetical protein
LAATRRHCRRYQPGRKAPELHWIFGQAAYNETIRP